MLTDFSFLKISYKENYFLWTYCVPNSLYLHLQINKWFFKIVDQQEISETVRK